MKKYQALLAMGALILIAGCAPSNEYRNNQEIGNKMEQDAQREKEICTALGDINCAQQ
ncbi:hypothetical protein VTH8203_02068 [Vibrio thalassae]|uniref:Lipoprotein n=1 Tax=Vibrio thalassae TaxID=1243014 RepID=A0A240EKG4_9VIBR|nr:hypothetical protein [Vibrio thalassae]SNX48450.1 hypothetical protein VTH8203_02068 [Vibrio thalassae]